MSTLVAPERLPPRLQALRDEILFELEETPWGGTPLVTSNPRTGANSTERDRVHTEGIGHGCHECRTTLATDSDQPWIGDHIPPWGLSDAARRAYALADHDDTWLVPSCASCSSLQSALVRRINLAGSTPPAAGTLSAAEQRMLGIGDTWRTFQPVAATGRFVLDAQGQHVQAAGIARGCHICNARVPHTRYIADHNPPAAFNTPSMLRLFKLLDIVMPDEVVLKAHCPRCSSGQGARIAAIMREADAVQISRGMHSARNPSIPWKFRDGSGTSGGMGGAMRSSHSSRQSSRQSSRRRDRSASPAKHGDKSRDRSRSRDYDKP